MKRKLGIGIGLVVLGTIIWVGDRLGAQQGAPPLGAVPSAMPLRTPVRLINLTQVVKKYNRWLNFQKEYKDIFSKEYEQEITKLNTQLEPYKIKLNDPRTLPMDKENAEKEAKRISRRMQEITDDAKGRLGKLESDMIVKIYKEIEDAVQGWARSSGVEMVLHYNDATEEPELHAAPNVLRKIGNGGCVPLYFAPGMDVSEHIIRILNSNVALTAGAVPPGAPGVPMPGVPPGQPSTGTGVIPSQYNPQQPLPQQQPTQPLPKQTQPPPPPRKQ